MMQAGPSHRSEQGARGEGAGVREGRVWRKIKKGEGGEGPGWEGGLL